MKLKTPKRAESYVPTASMADIAFLLIVFFMVTTTISVDRTTVQLPTSMERVETPKDSALIAIEENGVVHFSDGEEGSRVVNPSDILPAAAFIMSKNSLKFFLIKADGARVLSRKLCRDPDGLNKLLRKYGPEALDTIKSCLTGAMIYDSSVAQIKSWSYFIGPIEDERRAAQFMEHGIRPGDAPGWRNARANNSNARGSGA